MFTASTGDKVGGRCRRPRYGTWDSASVWHGRRYKATIHGSDVQDIASIYQYQETHWLSSNCGQLTAHTIHPEVDGMDPSKILEDVFLVQTRVYVY